MPRYPHPLDRLPHPVAESILGWGGASAVAQATHWYQPSASDAEFLTAADASYPASGGFIAIINPTTIGSVRGGLIDLRGTGSVWLGLVPGSPDVLRLTVNIGALKQLNIAYPGGDAALYDGTPKVAWGRYTSGGATQVGWGKVADGNHTSIASGTNTADATAVASVGNVAGANASIGGEYEVAAYNAAPSDAQIEAAVDALSLAGVTANRFLYPRPTVAEPTVITDPSTQVTDDTAHTWTISTVDGTSAIQAKS